MIKPYFILLLGMVISVLSCQNDNLIKVDYAAPAHLPYVLRLEDSLDLSLDLESGHDIYCLQFHQESGKDSLFALNHLLNSIDVYSITTGDLVSRLEIPREGPNAIRQISGFYVHNTDSVFIYPKGNLFRTLLSNVEGSVQSNPIPFARLNQSRIINTVSITKGRTVFYDKKLTSLRYPMAFDMPMDETGEFSYEIVVDIAQEQLHELPVFRPDPMQSGFWSHWAGNIGRVVDHRGRLIYNWPMSKELFIWENNQQESYQVKASLHQDEQPITPFTHPLNDQQDVQMMLENVTYRSLYFDPYRKLYYRIGLLPIAFDPIQHTGYLAFEHQPLAILVLDEDFTPLAEHYLPANTYKEFACFVGEKGLYIARTNTYYEDLLEDKLQFDVFRLVKK